MYGRSGLDRFKKAQSTEPFSVAANSSTKPVAQPTFREPDHLNVPSISQTHLNYAPSQHLDHRKVVQKAPDAPSTESVQQVTQVGGGLSTWQPPDWAIEPLPGVYYLDVVKDGEVLDRINLDKRRHIFGRQLPTCDFVLDHQSVSRQHAAVVPHRNGSIYVIDLGSVHGTFVANERLTKDSPVELEVGQSLRFAASTRIYILKKNNAALFHPSPQLTEVELPPSPDPSDAEAVLAYNTFINRTLNGHKRPNKSSQDTDVGSTARAPKRVRKARVSFKDQVGGELIEIVGFSDGVDVGTEPGPVGVKEGSLVGKYESLVQITVIPKGKEPNGVNESVVPKTGGVTEKLQQVLNKVKAPAKSGGGIYDDLFGESFSVGSSWAYNRETHATKDGEIAAPGIEREDSEKHSRNNVDDDDDDDDDDLFG